MTAEKLKRYPGMIVVKKETEARLAKLQKEIDELENKAERAERKHESKDRIVTLRAIKEERVKVTEDLLAKIEASTMEVERAITDVAPELTPLEMIIVTKLYIEGLNWNELMDELQTKPEYSNFCYERSTYMRAHRSALDKLGCDKK